jgi:hypothetical protein
MCLGLHKNNSCARTSSLARVPRPNNIYIYFLKERTCRSFKKKKYTNDMSSVFYRIRQQVAEKIRSQVFR